MFNTKIPENQSVQFLPSAKSNEELVIENTELKAQLQEELKANENLYAKLQQLMNFVNASGISNVGDLSDIKEERNIKISNPLDSPSVSKRKSPRSILKQKSPRSLSKKDNFGRSSSLVCIPNTGLKLPNIHRISHPKPDDTSPKERVQRRKGIMHKSKHHKPKSY